MNKITELRSVNTFRYYVFFSVDCYNSSSLVFFHVKFKRRRGFLVLFYVVGYHSLQLSFRGCFRGFWDEWENESEEFFLSWGLSVLWNYRRRYKRLNSIYEFLLVFFFRYVCYFIGVHYINIRKLEFTADGGAKEAIIEAKDWFQDVKVIVSVHAGVFAELVSAINKPICAVSYCLFTVLAPLVRAEPFSAIPTHTAQQLSATVVIDWE